MNPKRSNHFVKQIESELNVTSATPEKTRRLAEAINGTKLRADDTSPQIGLLNNGMPAFFEQLAFVLKAQKHIYGGDQ